MKSKPRSPIWPYLAVLACLFVLSVTAPRAWDRMARRGGSRKMVAAQQVASTGVRSRPAVPDEEIDPRELEPRDVRTSTVVEHENPSAVDSDATLVNPPVDTPQVVPPAPTYAQEVRSSVESDDRKPANAAADPDAPLSPCQDEPRAESDESAEAAPATAARWPQPRVLIEQLTQLRAADPKETWAEQAINLIRQLCDAKEGRRPDKEILAELRSLARLTSRSATSRELAAQTARARFSLTRWVDVWEQSASWDKVSTSTADGRTAPSISSYLADVEQLIGQNPSSADWRQYLMLVALSQAARPEATDADRRAVARKVIDRMTASHLTRAQRKFVALGPLTLLQVQLRAWAAEGVGSSRLLANLERYEHSSLPSDARAVADDWRGLKFAARAESELGSHLDTHYRNANVRVAVAAPLVNRMVPQPETVSQSIHDRILDMPVCGRATTFAKINVRLLPDPERVRLGLEARGTVASDTVSGSGPAMFRNQGQSTFLVRKLVVIGPDGMTTWRAVAQAENNYTNLVGMETNFDGVPLVGQMVRSIARSQHDEAQGAAIAEVEQKVAIRARDQFDAQVRPQLAKAVERVQTKQVATLKRLGLELVPLDMSTTPDRLVARMRLATSVQLGAHTPRPQAPSDSWFSVQMHQSALNNVLEQLDLAGRQFTLPELFTWIGQKLDRPEWANREDLPEDVRMKFAAKDAVRVRCQDGKVEVTFAFEELAQGSRRWRNFSVRAWYEPKPEGRDARLARDRTLEFPGIRGSQPLLRTIFSKVLSKSRDLHLLGERITSDPRMEGLEITQFVVEDGWVGLAYSPGPAGGTLARKPK